MHSFPHSAPSFPNNTHPVLKLWNCLEGFHALLQAFFAVLKASSNCSLLQQGALLNTENYLLEFNVSGKKKKSVNKSISSIRDAQNSVG